jgi:hypothetical protein
MRTIYSNLRVLRQNQHEEGARVSVHGLPVPVYRAWTERRIVDDIRMSVTKKLTYRSQMRRHFVFFASTVGVTHNRRGGMWRWPGPRKYNCEQQVRWKGEVVRNRKIPSPIHSCRYHTCARGSISTPDERKTRRDVREWDIEDGGLFPSLCEHSPPPHKCTPNSRARTPIVQLHVQHWLVPGVPQDMRRSGPSYDYLAR